MQLLLSHCYAFYMSLDSFTAHCLIASAQQ